MKFKKMIGLVACTLVFNMMYGTFFVEDVCAMRITPRRGQPIIDAEYSSKRLRLNLNRFWLGPNELKKIEERFADIGKIAWITELEFVRFTNESLSVMPSLLNIQTLRLNDCTKVTSLEWLSNFPNLEYLDLVHTRVTSLEWLSKCPNLQTLDLAYTRVTSLDGLQNCPNLQALNLCGCHVLTSLDGLQKCTKLQHLGLFRSGVTSLDGLQNCQNLQCLSLFRTNVTSLHKLQNCTNLQTLHLTYSELTSLDVLQNCQNLQHLNLCGCHVLTSLDGLQKCTKLQHLNLSYCIGLTSLDGLQNCQNLQYLNLFRSGVTSLAGTGLENLPKLQVEYL